MILFLLFIAASEACSTDINDIVYPPPEPEENISEDNDNDRINAEEAANQKKKAGISEEIHDKEMIDKIYIDREGRVLVPGTTSFEPVDKKRNKRHENDDGNRYQDHHHRHHQKPDYRPEPELSEKKGRTKSRLGITGPGYIFVPAK